MSIVLQLNPAVRDNYVFFCPEAPLHLSVLKPRGTSPRLTASILRGLRGKTLVDVNGVVDISAGKLKSETDKDAETKAALTEALEKAEAVIVEEVEVPADDVSAVEEKAEEPAAEEKKPATKKAPVKKPAAKKEAE